MKKREMFINVSLNKKKFEDLTNFIQLKFRKVKIRLQKLNLEKIFKTES